MKKDFETYLHDVGQKVSMTSLEKEAIFSNLKEAMNASKQPVVSTYTSLSFFGYQRIAGLAFAVLFIVGGVTSASAEYSFPGDLLYSFKTGVNEEVRGWFSKTPIAKAEWSIVLAERRLYELESIKENTKLSREAQKSLEDKFALQVDKAEQNTREYEFELKAPEVDTTLAQATQLAVSSEVSEPVASFSSRSISQEAQPSLMKIEEKDSNVEKKGKVESIKEPESPQILAKVEDLKDRIRTLRRSLRNAKSIESLDKGRVLRLEARLLKSQRTLMTLEKENASELEKNLIPITKSIFDIEQALDGIIPSTQNSVNGEVLGGSVELDKKTSDSSQKEESSEIKTPERTTSIEKPIEIRETIFENQDR